MTTAQLHEVVQRLVAVGQWRPGGPEVLIELGTGYDALRIADLPDDLSVAILGRLRSDRVMRRPTPLHKQFSLANPKGAAQTRRRVRLRRPRKAMARDRHPLRKVRHHLPGRRLHVAGIVLWSAR
ncbi:hypothetical protein [Streptomyces spongiae]|uniref:hypothetical protein n=1 Tax=Streptomyces spongiae TaxID=565072 RepID=UPI00188398BE|nr:hypothetical protein [Streptomyces spongiae]